MSGGGVEAAAVPVPAAAVSPVVSVRGLAKSYGRARALDGIDLSIEPGAVGLLGPNGAGKSTLVKLLLGLLRPDSGVASIAGHDPATRAGRLEVRRRVGYMPEGDCLIPKMSGVELVSTLGRTSGLARRDAIARAHEVLDYVGLEEARYRGLEEYSTGMKQRLKLAQALVHDPRLLLLDEPTNGLDPGGRRHMLELIHDLGTSQGKNVLLCSHLLPDVERTCERVVLIHRGRVLAKGSIEELTRDEERRVRVEIEADEPGVKRFEAGLAAAAIPFEREGSRRFSLGLPDEDGDAVFELARGSGAVVTGLTALSSSLEEVFLEAVAEAEGA